MKKEWRNLVIGVVIGSLCSGGAAFAKIGSEMINVSYSNIKVYKDNVLCDLYDANGDIVEPFVYHGTTYLPLRGTAQLMDVEVTYDSATKNVYLWDSMKPSDPSGTCLIDVCPPDSNNFYTYSKSAKVVENFEMAGENCSNGLKSHYSSVPSHASFQLDGKYAVLECTIGHTDTEQEEKTVTFIVDDEVVTKVTLEPGCSPKTVSVPLSYGSQLKIVGNTCDIGIADMMVR